MFNNSYGVGQSSLAGIAQGDMKSVVREIKESFLSVLAQLMGTGPVFLPGGGVIAEDHKYDAAGSIMISAFIEENNQKLSTALSFITFLRDMEKTLSSQLS